MGCGRSISKHVRFDSSSKHPNGIYPTPKILIQLPGSTGVEYETGRCFHCEFRVTGPRICVSLYILRRHEGGGVWLFVGGPTGMEVVVRGGQVIVGLNRKRIEPPGLATWSRIEMVVGVLAYVCDRLLGMSKNIVW